MKAESLKDILSGKLKLELLNGDVINLKTINSELKSFVKVSGAVDYAGTYELGTTKTVKDLLTKAKLKPEAKTDQAFILRKRLDQTTGIIAINIAEVLKGKINYNFEKEDELLIYDQARYTDQFSIWGGGLGYCLKVLSSLVLLPPILLLAVEFGEGLDLYDRRLYEEWEFE